MLCIALFFVLKPTEKRGNRLVAVVNLTLPVLTHQPQFALIDFALCSGR